MSRDTQRGKVYAAEEIFTGNTEQDYYGSVRAAQRAANAVTRTPFWKAMGGPAFVLVKATRKDAKSSEALPWRSEIRLDFNHPTQEILLHELAHTVLWHIDKRAADHGPEFVLILRRLVEEHISLEARIEFDHELDRWGAKYGLNGNTRLQTKLSKS